MSGVPLNLDWQQILLHLLNFVILFAILYFLLYKPVKNFMDKRRKAYEEMDEEANAAKAEAEQILTEYQEKLSGVDAEIETKKQEAIEEAQQLAKNIQAKAEQEASEILAKAKTQARSEHDRIVDDASDEITKMAKEAAAKVVFQNTSEAYDSFLDTVEEQK